MTMSPRPCVPCALGSFAAPGSQLSGQQVLDEGAGVGAGGAELEAALRQLLRTPSRAAMTTTNRRPRWGQLAQQWLPRIAPLCL